MISSDRLDFLNPRFLVERERFSQSLQLSVNQTINSPGTSEESLEVVCNERFEAFFVLSVCNSRRVVGRFAVFMASLGRILRGICGFPLEVFIF